MDSPRKMKVLADGVTFSSVIDGRFKTNRISVNLVTRLSRETVTINALIPQVLKKGYSGCEDMTELNQRLQELYGACVDADVQKRGDYQILSLSITTIDDKFALHGEPIAAKAAEIVCDMALHPLEEDGGFRAQYVEIEKEDLIDTIEAEINEKRGYAINSLIREMCAAEPFGLPKYGFREQVAPITPAAALAHYRELLRTSRIEILFTGCGDADGACQVFEAAFLALPRAYAPLPAIKPHEAAGQLTRKTENLAVSQSKLVLGFSCGIPADGEAVPAYRLMAAILGGTPSSKLFLNVREKLSLCYYCAARYDTYKGLLIIDSGVENENIEKAEKEILAQLQAIREGDVSDGEYKSALLSLQNAYSTIYESDTTVESFYLGQLLTGLDSTPEAEKERLSKLCKADIVAAAKGVQYDMAYLLTGKEEEQKNG